MCSATTSLVVLGQANEGMIVAVTDSSEHHLLFYEGNPTQTISTARWLYYTGTTTRIYSVAADYRNGDIFCTQNVPGNIKRVKNINIWLNSTLVSTTFHRGISNAVSQIAVDWIHGNVYWADTHFHWIMVQSYKTNDTSMYRILMNGLQEPVGLAVDPTKGYIFWSNVGDNPTISRATLAGNDITDLAHAGITRPTGLTLDYTKELIFWVDDARDTLERMTYNGENRQMVRRINGQQIVSLAFYEDAVFVTFYKLEKVIGISTHTGALYKEFSTLGGNPTGITLFNAAVQPMIKDLCAEFGCDHICVKTPSGQQCLCKNGYNLQSDKKSCQEDTGTWKQEVVFGIGSQICIANIRLLASSESLVYNCPISVDSDIEGLEADMEDHIIFYYIQGTIYRYLLVKDVSEELVQITGSIGGMVYDWLDDIIYWTETTNGRIKTMTLANKNHVTIHTDLLSPGAITADPHASVLFWISGTTSPTIIRSDMDGDNTQIIVSGLQINTTDLTFDATTDRIYWLNNGYIKSAKTDGTGVQLGIRISNGGSLISVYRDYLFWTENTGTTSKLRSGTVSDNTGRNWKTFSGIITALTVYDSTIQPAKKGPCWVDNGGCEHVCIPKSQNRVCKCKLGYTLETDGVSCSSDSLVGDFLFLTDTTNGEIYQVSVTNGDVKAFDVENVGNVLGIAYHTQDDSIYWSDFNTGIWYSSVGSTPASRQVYKLWTYYAKRVTIDETTDNLYYTAYSKSHTDGYIAVYNELKNIHRKIITDRKEPLAIQLDPPEGIMYWSEVGPGEVYKSNMDGSNTQSILSGLTWPNGLAIDRTAKTLYYMDGKDNTIGAIDLTNFGNRPISTENTNAHLMDAIVSGGYLYYTAWNRNYVTRLDPNNPRDKKIGENPEYGRLEGVYVVDGVKMPQNADCSERNGMCSGLCLPTSTGRTCACRDTVNLNSDKLTCENDIVCTGIPNGTLPPSCLRYEDEVCTFSCNTGYELATDTSVIRCEVGGNWNVSTGIFCKEKLCPDGVTNGMIESSCRRNIGSVCPYTCNSGYTADPDVGSISCMTTSNWAQDLTKLCSETLCPRDFKNGAVTDCQRKIGNTCGVVCDTGYAASSDISLTCQASGNWNSNTSNICQAVLCPSNIANGGLVNCERMVGHTCSVECDTGYSATSSIQLVCQSSGSWDRDTAAICQAKLCPDELANGSFECQRRIGTSCGYRCDQGYAANANVASVECISPGTWARELSDLCTPVLCPSNIANGGLVNCERMVGHTCSVECDTGYSATSNIQLVCQSSGSWDRDTAAICQAILCPRTLSNGAVTSCQRRVGDVCSVTCADGYIDNASVSLACLSSGDWNRDTSNICQEILCPRTINNGFVNCQRRIGDTCHITCDTGYVDKSSVILTCQSNGNWDRATSNLCEPRACPLNFHNGVLSNGCTAFFGEVCVFSCKEDYTMTPPTLTVSCLSSGDWSTQLSSVCQPKLCPDELANGSFECQRRIGTSCGYRCDQGYAANANVASVECISPGTWARELSDLCTLIRCSGVVPNGQLNTGCDLRVNSLCSYSCVAGYTANADVTTITCLSSGAWSIDVNSLCKPSLCPSDIENGGLVNCERMVGDKCSVECDTGYEDTSNVQLVCRSSGSWDRDTRKICEEIRCDITTTNVHLLNGCQGRIGESCTFVCPEGYASTTENIPRCLGTGEWSLNLAGLCEARMCSESLTNGHLDDECDLSVGTECKYSCNTGYTKDASVSTLECSSSGDWVPDVNNLCQLFLCPDQIPNGGVDGNCERVIGSVCGYHCSAGFSPDSTADFLRCVHPGNWDGDVNNICAATQCPDTIQNVQLDDDCDASVGSICSFTCDLGYKKESSVAALTCLTSGSWSPDATNLCHKKCEDSIQNGKVDGDCSSNAGHECTYTCDTGYRPQSDGKLVCLNSGTWNIDVELACEEIICPLSVPNGALSDGCAGKMGDVCYYTCVGDNMKNEEVTSLTCLSTALWSTAPTDLCIPPQPEESSSTGTIIGAGAGAGGFLLLLVIIVVVVVVICRKRRNRDSDRDSTCAIENPVFQNCENDYLTLRDNRASYMGLTFPGVRT
ncbi:hypothetical protein ScPMuIL_002356 [Solemya velum]